MTRISLALLLSIPRGLRRRLRALRRDEAGAIAIEFALIMPVAVLILLFEFALGEAIGVSRKTAITGRTIADLVARRTAISPSDLDVILNASAKIIAPFPTSPMKIILAQVSTDADGVTKVTDLTRAYNDTPLTKGDVFALPTGMGQPGASLVYVKIRYDYAPPIAATFLAAVPISYSFYINPRGTSSVQLLN